ncbi:MAG: tetratricopeptide repeat protein [Pyrinomonadaceae bacterium]
MGNRQLAIDNRQSVGLPPFFSSYRRTLVALLSLIVCSATTSAQRAGTPALTITSEPNAIVWLDEIRRGTTDSSGKLAITKVTPGRHTVRVRANGFKEATIPLLPGKRTVAVKLVRSTDPAELAFQRAETTREQARTEDAQRQAAEIYREALKLRPAYPAARVGLARVLLELNEYHDALAEIEAARRSRPIYAEASAVEGRLHREGAFEDKAIASFRRAIREGKGVQPEAHVGLARLYEENGRHEEAIAEYQKALAQLSDSEPVIYQLLGAAYEKQQKYKEALASYEKYLALAPNGSLAPALRSIIEQLRRDAAGQEIIP